ncbi:MAG: glycoside hydrolase family 13 protein [Turicibacter sp.]|nr:glycoside hydrolase family 13 protein [Turicibacter sp.]
MNLHAIYHRPNQNYAYSYDEKTIHLRLRTAKNDVKQVTVKFGDPYHWTKGGGGGNLNAEGAQGWISHEIKMKKEASTDLFDFWFVSVNPEFRRMRYAFIVEDESEQVLFGEKKIVPLTEDDKTNYPYLNDIGNFFCFPFLNPADIFNAPKWVKSTVWYQIFPERFANANPDLNPENTVEWGSIDPKGDTFYGGDLEGVIKNLDYLQELGINGIYFCPIFKSPSTHKYDTTDYFEIDPQFGDKKTFKRLVEEAHKRGIKIMLDAVFNHCGWNFPQWQDVVKYGEKSSYKDWFHIHKFPLIEKDFDPIAKPGGLNYDTFAFAKGMPKLNTENPEVIDYFLEVGRYWVREFDIDGWRLDVANEVDHTFWRLFRNAVREVKEDVYILGEIWHDSQPWLNGDQFDAVMNYPLGDAILKYVAQDKITSSEFSLALNKVLTDYARNVNEVAFNLLDSHDTQRLLTVCGGHKQKALLAYTLQMTQTGTPCIYYGGEIGLDGGADPLCRKCMIWDEEEQDREMFDYLKQLIHLRKTHPSLTSPDLEWLSTNDEDSYVVFKKESDIETTYVVINNSNKKQMINLSFMPKGAYNELLSKTEVIIDTLLPVKPYTAYILKQV